MNIQQQDDRIKQLMADIGWPNSMSLYKAFKQFSQELTFGLIGSNWGPKTEYKNPYDIPHIVLQKVKLEEVLGMLRRMIHQERMKSSPNKTTFASKPYWPAYEDERLILEGYPEFPNPNAYFQGDGCFGAHMPKGITFYSLINDSRVWVYTNLSTDATIISTDCETWYPWVEDKMVAINMVHLKANAEDALS